MTHPTSLNRRQVLAATALASPLLAPMSARAQAYPAKPVRLELESDFYLGASIARDGDRVLSWRPAWGPRGRTTRTPRSACSRRATCRRCRTTGSA